MNPKISLIIPTIGRDTLRRTLESVIATNYPKEDLSIIVVNAEVNEEKVRGILNDTILMSGYGYHLVITEEQLLPGQAKNEGLKYAKGMFVTFLDDDDTALSAKFFTLSKYLIDHPETFAVYGYYNIRNCETGEIKRTQCGGNENTCFDTLLENNYIASGSIMYRNASVVRFDDVPYGFGEDFLLNCKLLARGLKIDFIKESIYCWTQNIKEGFTATFRKKGIDWHKLVEENKQRVLKWKEENEL